MWNQKRHDLLILVAVVFAGRLIVPETALAGGREPMPAPVPDAAGTSISSSPVTVAV
jgi:hypothetical protein